MKEPFLAFLKIFMISVYRSKFHSATYLEIWLQNQEMGVTSGRIFLDIHDVYKKHEIHIKASNWTFNMKLNWFTIQNECSRIPIFCHPRASAILVQESCYLCATFPLASRKLEFTIGFGKFGKQTLIMGKLIFIWSFPVET